MVLGQVGHRGLKERIFGSDAGWFEGSKRLRWVVERWDGRR